MTSDGEAARALGSPDFAYVVTTVTSLAAAQAQLSGAAAAYDCVVAEHAVVSDTPARETTAFFRAAAALHTPVVLMGEQPSQATVLQGVRWGAVDFLYRPLSLAKLRNLWQHKIRKMMVLGNSGTVPRRLSLPQLPSSSDATGGDSARSAAAPPGDSALSGASARGTDLLLMPRAASLPGLICPDTPSLHTASLGAPQPTSSAGSGGSGSGGSSVFQVHQPSTVQAARAGERSDATSGVQPAGAAAALHDAVPAGPPAPLACVRLGAAGEALPAAVLHWPTLPAGTAWGTPVGCGVPPPLPAAQAQASPAAAAAFLPPSIKWCSPGSLPVPASSYDLLLPEDFSLARTAAEAGTNGPASRGPLRLKLTITPELLAGLNRALQA